MGEAELKCNRVRELRIPPGSSAADVSSELSLMKAREPEL